MASDWNLAKLKSIEQKSKDIVSGYIRQSQFVFKTDNPYYIIPPLVHYLCIGYYHISEFFMTKSERVTLNDDKTIITYNSKEGYVTAYGNVHINVSDKSIYTWTFKILYNGIDEIHIGIDTINPQQDDDKLFCEGNTRNSDDFYAAGAEFYHFADDREETTTTTYEEVPYFHNNGIISMEFNCVDKSLNYCFIDDKDKNEEIKFGYNCIELDMNRTYRMAIGCGWINDCVQLLKFEESEAF